MAAVRASALACFWRSSSSQLEAGDHIEETFPAPLKPLMGVLGELPLAPQDGEEGGDPSPLTMPPPKLMTGEGVRLAVHKSRG